MNFSIAACAQVHLFLQRDSFGCQLALYILLHLLQTCFIFNSQTIPLWKWKIHQKMAKNMIPSPKRFISCSKSKFTGKQINGLLSLA